MLFRIRALDVTNRITQLQVEASDEASARAQVQADGLTVLSASRAHTLSLSRQRFPVLLFCQELLALLRSGLSLVEGLEVMAEKEGRTLSRTVLSALIDALRQGKTLSMAMSAQTAIFPDLLVAMIRASERTSDLDQALERYVAYSEQLDSLRGKLVAAATYPVILLVVGMLVVLFLLVFVVPEFSKVYEDISTELPLASQWLLAWGHFVKANSASLGLGLLVVVIGIAWTVRQPAFRQGLMAQFERVPGIGSRMRVFRLARFFRTVGMLLRGGIPVVQSLELVRELLPLPMQQSLTRALLSIREGRTASDAFTEVGLSTAVASRMLRVGERAGNLGDMMERIAAFHDEEMTRWLDRATRLFGPLLMLVIGLAIGGVVVLMYLPIFQLAESLQ
ncbi:type II secretion system F family protein [Methyloversatilis discipulorum]|uniref:type II secretion system F family protein n=1 Tax=Methyloversatilis discipulorum TaxID=1119528 RepID=UPI001A37DE1D|nr:type II secretion system F family protein [Methyloversatilis discipulorum]MBL8466902.1 type II secretion system F family protein [Methyloversatilis discipulorum]